MKYEKDNWIFNGFGSGFRDGRFDTCQSKHNQAIWHPEARTNECKTRKEKKEET